jgi:hypothetical protein
MKKAPLLLLLLLSAYGTLAQEDKDRKRKDKDDEIVYYTDSDVKNFRLGVALNANPVNTDLRLINDDFGEGGAFTATSDEASGTWKVNYHLDLIYELSSTFDLSVGFGYAYGGYTLGDVDYFGGGLDTLTADYQVDVSMYTVPVKINFNSSISEVFDLEVVPMIELNFIDRYQGQFLVAGQTPQPLGNVNDSLQSTNYSVGIMVGGQYWVTNDFGFFVRGGIKYMLNQMVDIDAFPRETLLNLGANVGVRYNF